MPSALLQITNNLILNLKNTNDQSSKKGGNNICINLSIRNNFV